MIIVTGAAGFIGSNLIKGLNKMGYQNILAVDDLSDGKKFKNLVDCDLLDYKDYEDFLEDIIFRNPFSLPIQAIFHEGACSETIEWDGRYMMENNYTYSKHLLHYCLELNIPFIYASSAAVYGRGDSFSEVSDNEKPLNVYGYSKWLFDQYVRRLPQCESQIVGLRYFNVYGPQENHKGKMASVAFHLMNQLRDTGKVRIFEGYDGYADGEQSRDFIYIQDVVKINLWMLNNPKISGIFNVGTGKNRSFNAIAKTLITLHGSGELEYIAFPPDLKGVYQSFTKADITQLRNAGYTENFYALEQGLQEYYQWFLQNN